MKTITIDASKYADHDDCLAAAAADVSAQYGLAGWDLDPRWEDTQRDIIQVTVPDHASSVESRGEAA